LVGPIIPEAGLQHPVHHHVAQGPKRKLLLDVERDRVEGPHGTRLDLGLGRKVGFGEDLKGITPFLRGWQTGNARLDFRERADSIKEPALEIALREWMGWFHTAIKQNESQETRGQVTPRSFPESCRSDTTLGSSEARSGPECGGTGGQRSLRTDDWMRDFGTAF
jgi:hypothetical protein